MPSNNSLAIHRLIGKWRAEAQGLLLAVHKEPNPAKRSALEAKAMTLAVCMMELQESYSEERTSVQASATQAG